MRWSRRVAACIVAVGAAIGGACAVKWALTAPIETREGVRFVFSRPDARRVSLAGTFNDWSTSSLQMAQEGPERLWTAIVRLPQGEHLFMYVVDGTEWVSPPMAEDFSDDGFGARNGVVIVRATER